jgi:hypothetical protein
MESNKDNGSDGGDEHQQLPKSVQNRLAEAAGKEDQSCSNNKNRDEGNDLLEEVRFGLNESENYNSIVLTPYVVF